MFALLSTLKTIFRTGVFISRNSDTARRPYHINRKYRIARQISDAVQTCWRGCRQVERRRTVARERDLLIACIMYVHSHKVANWSTPWSRFVIGSWTGSAYIVDSAIWVDEWTHQLSPFSALTSSMTQLPEMTILCSASCGGWQRDTARICCWAQFAVVRRSAALLLLGARRPPLTIDISCRHGAQQQTRRSCVRMVGRTDRQTDGRPTVS